MGQSARSFSSWIRYSLGLLVALVVLLLLTGTAYQYVENRRDLRAQIASQTKPSDETRSDTRQSPSTDLPPFRRPSYRETAPTRDE